MSGREPNSPEAQFAAWAPKLERVVSKLVNTSRSNVEDACSFAWLQLVRLRPHEQTAFAWLVTVAKREAICLDAHDRARDTLEPDPVIVEAADRALQWVAVREALAEVAALPDRQREVFALQVSGYSYAEIAALTGRTPTAVNRHLARAHHRLRHPRRNERLT